MTDFLQFFGISNASARKCRDRLTRIQNLNTDLEIELCLDPLDLATSKLVAGRAKDHDFVQAMLRQGIIDAKLLLERVGLVDLPKQRIASLRSWIVAASSATPSPGSAR